MPTSDKPSQLSAAELRSYLIVSGGQGETIPLLATALLTKYAAPFGTLVLVLLGAPLALAFDRRKILNALGAAVLLSLLFWILTNVCQQLGVRSLMPVIAAAWTPTILFGSFTVFLVSRTRT
jgi:lipopolysaccharide export LptBFGC system permease protein LptF